MKKKIVSIGIVLCLGFVTACGNTSETTVVENTSEVSMEQESVVTEETNEASVLESVNEAIENGNYDEAMSILESSQSKMETDEYAIKVSNIHLYKNDYVAAADVLVEKIKETDSAVLKDRLEYIRESVRLVEANAYDENGNLSYTSVYEYDTQGNLTKRTELDAEGNVSQSHEFEYDDKGNKTKSFGMDGSGSTYVSLYENEYDSNGALTKVATCSEDGTIDFLEEYDDNGNVVLMTCYQDNNPFSYYKYTFDDKGNETSVEFEYISGEYEGSLTSYEYTEENGIIKKVGYDKDGNIECTMEYDEYGNTLKDDSMGFAVLEYKYDSLNKQIYNSMIGEGIMIISNIENTYEFVGTIEE